MLRLHSVFGYNGNGRENLLWHPGQGLFVYTVGCNVIIEELTNHQQIFLRGFFETNVVFFFFSNVLFQDIQKKSRPSLFRRMEMF